MLIHLFVLPRGYFLYAVNDHTNIKPVTYFYFDRFYTMPL
jgi:hypothetical protein